jgi:SAM-dependent methyltransferase
MQPEVLDFSQRAHLTERMDEPCSREELRACLRDLARVNRWLLGYRPVLDWLESLDLRSGVRPVRILDVGCGYGDGLRRVETWANARAVAVELEGIDLNPDTIAIATEASGSSRRIRWTQGDVFGFAPERPFDLVVSSLFTHHLDEAGVVRFVRWLESHARAGWCINDLSRNAIPYHLFRAFAKVMGLHPFVQRDGPVSIARAFVEEDWRRMCVEAGMATSDVVIRGFTPGRLCVMRRKPL